jgi:hypothetical protein
MLPAGAAACISSKVRPRGRTDSLHPRKTLRFKSVVSGKVRNIRQEWAAFETLHLQTKGPQIPLQVESGVLFPENNLFQVELNLLQKNS